MLTNLPNLIFLCGFMGAGKSVAGQALARKTALPFKDLDAVIEEKAGTSIADIFKNEGEAAFRKMERSSLLEVIRTYKGVLALGGGTLQNQHLVDHLKINGLLIFIETPISVILQRILEQPNRPLLVDEAGNIKEQHVLENELRELYEQRLPLYEQAEIKISNSKFSSVDKLVEKLVKKIRNHVSHY